MRRLFTGIAALLVALSTTAWGGGAAAEAQQAPNSPGAVYAMTNDATNNQVVVLNRAADGMLTPAGSFPTGGRGSGTFENSANGLVLGEDVSPNNLRGNSKYLFATNAGSNSISVFETRSDGTLTLVEQEPSGGDHPISVTIRKNILYVLNGGATNCTGGTPTISGFSVGPQGTLTPIPGSTRPVSGGANSGCAQVSFTPDGDVLAVTQRQADKIDTYLVGKDGVASGPIVNETPGVGPFGFTFTQRGQLLSTENFGAAPGQGGASSYDVRKDGTLVPISGPVRNNRSDTCWFVLTDNQKFGFVTNFQSGDISSYRVESDGTLLLLNSIAGTVGIGASDQTLSGDSHFLYARNALQGTISVFRVDQTNGTLTPIQTVTGLPPGGAAIGIAAK